MKRSGSRVSLPVVPQLGRVAVERRHADARALERFRGLAVVVAGGPVDELEHVLRDAQVVQHRAHHSLYRRQRSDAIEYRRRYETEHPGIETHRHLRRVSGLGEDVEHFADPLRLRVGQVEALAVEPFLVREIVERIGDEIHRHDVDASALDADHRHPRRHHAAHLLEEFEEVVRPVDLVDVAGLGVADDEPRPVDAERPLAFFAHHPLGIVLGLEVRMIEVFGFVEHVLAEHAVVEPGSGDRTDMLEAAGPDGFRKLHGVARPVDVRRLLCLSTCLDVVDRRQVEEVADLALELLHVGVRYAQVLLRKVANDGDDVLVGRAPFVAQRVELLDGFFAHQNVDGLAAR